MKKNEERRIKIVESAIKDIAIPKTILLNKVNGEKELLKNMIIEKLSIDLLEQECSNTGNKPFDWILEDFKGCQNLEDFIWFLPQSYRNNGELYYTNTYDFSEDEG